MDKLTKCLNDFGYESLDDALVNSAPFLHDSIAPGICMNDGCNHTTEYEPDCATGYCECCGTQSVKSVLLLAGLI